MSLGTMFDFANFSLAKKLNMLNISKFPQTCSIKYTGYYRIILLLIQSYHYSATLLSELTHGSAVF